MLSAFIDLLRSTLAVKNTTIPLSDELETTRKYLVVQTLRYGEKINYEIEMPKDTEAVSYTHLDVYKRQPMNEALAADLWDVGQMGAAAVTGMANYDELIIGEVLESTDGQGVFVSPDCPVAQDTGFNPSIPTVPVSYTHLDVYKRQVIITAEAKGIALAYEISKILGKNEFIVARKSIKSYMSGVVSVSVHSITTSGEQRCV